MRRCSGVGKWKPQWDTTSQPLWCHEIMRWGKWSPVQSWWGGGTNHASIPQKVKWSDNLSQQCQSQVCAQENWKLRSTKKLLLQCSQHNSKKCNSPEPRCSSVGEWIKKCDPFTHQNITQLWKGEKPSHSLPHGGTLRTRCSVREADTEGHTGCDSTDGKHPEQADHRRSRFLVVRGWRRTWEVTAGGDQASLWSDGLFWN